MILKQLFGRSPYKWDWLQVEVSSLCHAACTYCPTRVYQQYGDNLLMSLDTFMKLSPSLSQTKLVYLQGWGEPFLSPHFFEMVRIAKLAGCKVGTTTNGMLLDTNKLIQLVHSGMDVIAFSLAGCTKTNNTFRQGTRLEQVLETIKQLNIIKQTENVSHPEIHIAYMLMRSSLEEIDQLPALVANLGVSQVVVSTLTFAPTQALESEMLIPSTESEYSELKSRLDVVVNTGNKFNLDIRYQIIAPLEPLDKDPISIPSELDFATFLATAPSKCIENIQRSIFVSANGDLSPCVFAHLPVRSPEVVTTQAGRLYQPLIFGNIHDQSMDTIWQSKNYQEFRQSHRNGKLKGLCYRCLKPREHTG